MCSSSLTASSMHKAAAILFLHWCNRRDRLQEAEFSELMGWEGRSDRAQLPCFCLQKDSASIVRITSPNHVTQNDWYCHHVVQGK
jgi:hypothetical protein